jgi:hypothetical protein
VLRADRAGNQRIVTVQVARCRGVTIAAAGLIVAELAWKAAILRHFYFWQDDFLFFDRGLNSGFSWQYLMKVEGGHLDPGPFACSWLLARISLYNWTLVSAVILAILAASSLAMLRLLRTLFGNRPAILIPLVIYLFSPLTVPAVVWWSSAIETLPLQLATCMAMDAHVRYVRGRQARHLVLAVVWLVVGLAFFEKAMVVPLLLLAVTAGFLTEGTPLAALRSALVRYRHAWLAYAIILAVYAGVFAVQVTRPGATPGKRGTPQEVPGLVAGLIKTTFVSGAFGGPWRWFPSGVQAFATPPAVLGWLAVLAAAIIVGVSIARRREAWRAWAILAGWLTLADLVPIVVGRSVLIDPRFRVFLPLDTHYVADAVPVLAICLGLAFWPVAGQPDHGRAPQAAGTPQTAPERATGRARARRAAALAMGLALGVFLLGSAWSVQAYLHVTTTGPGRAFLANARRAVGSVPRGTPVVNQFAGSGLMSALVLGPYGYDSEVVGSLAPGRIRWTRQPDGTIAHLQVLDTTGTLRPAAVVGVVSRLVPNRGGCWPVHGKDIDVSLDGLAGSARHQTTIRMSYVSSADQHVLVSFGGTQAVALRRGLNTAYLPVSGTGRSVTIVTPGSARTLCVGSIAVGALLPNLSGPRIPAHPVLTQPAAPSQPAPSQPGLSDRGCTTGTCAA